MVEIIPKKPAREIPLKNVSFFIAGALLLAAIFGYVILLRSEAKALLSIQNLEEGISKIGSKEDKNIEGKVFNYEDKIKNFKDLLAGRRKSSQFFDNFGSLIHPQVWFSSFEFDLAEIRVVVSGKTANFKTLEQQLIFLKGKNDVVESFDLSDAVMGDEGGADFNLTIDFTDKIFDTLK